MSQNKECQGLPGFDISKPDRKKIIDLDVTDLVHLVDNKLPNAFEVCNNLYVRLGHSRISEKKTRDYYFLGVTNPNRAVVVKTWNGYSNYQAVMTTVDQSLIDSLNADTEVINNVVGLRKQKEKPRTLPNILALPLFNRLTQMFRGQAR